MKLKSIITAVLLGALFGLVVGYFSGCAELPKKDPCVQMLEMCKRDCTYGIESYNCGYRTCWCNPNLIYTPEKKVDFAYQGVVPWESQSSGGTPR